MGQILLNKLHEEKHRSEHIGWLRAAVLGANDGIVSTASLIVGVASANTSHKNIILTATAGLFAGALSMAAGEYVSVSTQADTEKADLDREKNELINDTAAEHAELTQIYIERGLNPKLATQVAKELMAHNALESHARDELGITTIFKARPIQAAFSSAAAFSCGAALPVIMVLFSPHQNITVIVSASSLLFLILLGILAARVGRAPLLKSVLRISFWGTLAMVITATMGSVFDRLF